jgi:hypothetical protein
MPQARSRRSPFLEGFAALWHDPALLAAELMWRWCFGLAAWSLAIVGAIWFLDSLDVSAHDQLLLQTWQPMLLQGAVKHILQGSLLRFTVSSAALVLGLTLLWCFASAAGRAAILGRLVAMFRGQPEDDIADLHWHFSSILTLQLVRAAWSLLARVIVFAAILLAMIMAADQHPLRASLLFIFGAGVAGAFEVVLTRLFGLAPVFCVRNSAGPSEALAQAVDFSGRSGGRLVLPVFGFFLLRLLWFGTMFYIAIAAVALSSQLASGWAPLLVAVVLALLYFAGADFLTLARLAACVAVVEDGCSAFTALNSPEPDPMLPTGMNPSFNLA